MEQKQVLDWYGDQDSRLKDPEIVAEIIANRDNIDFDTLMSVGKGSAEIHYVKIMGDNIPFRVLTQKEERMIKHATHVEIQNDPLYQFSKNDSAEFFKLYMKKAISLATSPCIQVTDDKHRHYTEAKLDNMPAVTFASIVTAYQQIEREYNPGLGQFDNESIRILIGELLNPEKKSILLAGMTSLQMRSILEILFDRMIGQQDNITIATLLENILKPNEA